ncbi:MAG: SLBB domain-containing protein [Bacteroidetes bacterium]|nr:SLBB domain-containing protein [Bacteroidota bacterium]
MKRLFFFLFISVALFSCTRVYSQKEQTTGQNTNILSNTTGNQNMKINADATDILSQLSVQNQSMQQKTFPVDKAINPDLYFVGPNDVFNLGIYGFLNQTVSLTVNLEGSLVIPSVGEVKVNGLSLTEAKEKVIKAVKKRYYSSEISLTLSMPRFFLISVSSLIQKKIEVTPLTRTSDIFSLIFFDTLNIQRIKYDKMNPKGEFSPDISLRNIQIIRKNGTAVNVDLYRYFNTNNDEFNPYFQEGDLLKIPFGQLIKNYISVDGAVQLPGVYEYNPNDNLESAISLGRGFDKDAEIDSVTVFRVDPITKRYNIFTLDFNNDKNFRIENFDRVLVKFKSQDIKNYSVIILGEVNRPGIYPISQKNTTLKEAIEMAGGFKSNAYLPLSILMRKYDDEYTKKDTAEIMLNIRANDLIVKEQDRKNFDIDVLSRRYRMIVDFEKLFKENDLSQNVALENKDVIYVNDDKKVVYVYGQVQNEGYVPYKEGENYEYYINKAGGYSLAAEEGDTRVIRFNSRGWYKADKTNVQSGDFIYVPKVVKTPFNENLTLISTIIGTLVSIISTYLLVKSANK